MGMTRSRFGAVFFYSISCLLVAWSVYTAIHWLEAMGFRKHLALAASVNLDGKGPASELEGGLQWFNVAVPLRLETLRGKIVLLDFWTHGCINCQNVMPDLKRLEQKYADELVVVGVHSAKFTNERAASSIRNAILRNNITHPVVNDADFAIWGKYDVQGWPTWVLIDPAGQKVATAVGEGHFEQFDFTIRELMERHSDTINREPIPVALEKDKTAPTLLSFPGKIFADENSERLFIADSRHNRIVITDFDGTILDIAGVRDPGNNNGTFEGARFRNPQGMALDGNTLLVADAGNHLVRALDLEKRIVTTLAGTGDSIRQKRGGDALGVALNSPWDLALLEPGGDIIIAVAGSHQLWKLDRNAETLQRYAGTGGEELTDAPALQALFAQPSGLALNETAIYIADSEASALRVLDRTSEDHRVETLIGRGLFDFGHVDGPFAQASLQRPLGIALDGNELYIADTYNNRIRLANMDTQELVTLAGDGNAGLGSETDPLFHEPGGLAVTEDWLFIADTNNHSIRRMNRETGVTETLFVRGDEWTEKPKPQTVFSTYPVEKLSGSIEGAGGEAVVRFDFPKDMGFNTEAPTTIQFRVTSSTDEWISEPSAAEMDGETIRFPLHALEGDGPQLFEAAVSYFYCPKEHPGLCYMGNVVFQLEVDPSVSPEDVEYTHTVSATVF